MAQLSWNEIHDRAAEFASKWDGETYEKGESQTFWSEFLTVFGIDRRRHGAFFEYAIKKGSGSQGFIDMFWPGKLLAEQKSGGRDLQKAKLQAYEYLETMPDHDLPQAIVVSDFASFVFIELNGINEKVEFTLHDFPKHVKLFGFLLGETSKQLAEANPVNVKAAEAMARLHNQLRDDNYTGHDLEVLLVRLVFCMFADDSGIFDQQTLREFVEFRTSEDGSDLGPRLMQVFQALNTPNNQRQSSLDESIAALPYVNGGLFEESIRVPYFNSQMRRDLIATMKLDWSKVSPAIFGSMFQGVMDEKQRRNLGAHYTSEKNILRVIKPLFLDDLYQEFATANVAGVRKKYEELRKLQDKIADLKFLDPACGCGNFLVITYRELRKLEHKIVEILAKGEQTQDMFATAGSGAGTLKVNVDQMYGIEIEEFPSLIAQAALWLTDHQMNIEYSRQSGRTFKRLPLTHSATIVNGNALTIDWAEVIEPSELDYILGNPPFIGAGISSWQGELIIDKSFEVSRTSKLDYVANWYFLSAAMMVINREIKTALVSTNSISQGEQPALLWDGVMSGFEINFAHQTFKWSNDAPGVAAVFCVVIGFSLVKCARKRVFEYSDIKGEPNEISTENINRYLLSGPNILIDKRRKPISNVPDMIRGSIPYDNGNLILSHDEYQDAILSEPLLKNLIRRYGGAYEMLSNQWRYCLWLVDVKPEVVRSSKLIKERVQANKLFRESSTTSSVNRKKDIPAIFGDIRQPSSKEYLMFPRVSSQKRNYLPIGYYSNSTVVADSAYAIPNATKYHFGILSSQMHMAWMRVVAGRLKSDYRYSNNLVYNNFIWPDATNEQKAHIETLAQATLDARDEFPDSSLADLYDPLTMPPILAKAHKTLDRAVDKLYRKEPFATDAERVALLFEKYQAAVL